MQPFWNASSSNACAPLTRTVLICECMCLTVGGTFNLVGFIMNEISNDSVLEPLHAVATTCGIRGKLHPPLSSCQLRERCPRRGVQEGAIVLAKDGRRAKRRRHGLVERPSLVPASVSNKRCEANSRGSETSSRCRTCLRSPSAPTSPTPHCPQPGPESTH